MRKLSTLALATLLWACAAQGETPVEHSARFSPLPPPSQEELDSAAVITNPTWIARPTGQDYVNAYPPDARDNNISGEASLHCMVRDDGRLACRAQDDGTPYDFEGAALQISTGLRMAPVDAEGESTAGRRYNMRIAFRSTIAPA